MELIRSYCFFGLLGDLAVFRRRKEFRRYGCINDVCKRLGQSRADLRSTLGLIGYEISYEGLGNRAVNAVHGHVVTIICCPAQSELGKVTRAYYDSALLVCNVHQDLRTLSCL